MIKVMPVWRARKCWNHSSSEKRGVKQIFMRSNGPSVWWLKHLAIDIGCSDSRGKPRCQKGGVIFLARLWPS